MDKQQLPIIKLNNLFKGKSDIPVWFMRQAGRYLPEYREIRAKTPTFLDLCFNPDIAKEITLQPIKRFDLDAAIIFSDILVIPFAMGSQVEFLKNSGPILSGLVKFDERNFVKKLSPVYSAISKTRKALDKNKPLIGFAGAPFTLLRYLLFKNQNYVEKQLNRNYYKTKELLDVLEEAIFIHLTNQIKAGADVVKIFDSWAGLISDDLLFREFVTNPTKRIVSRLKEKHPKVPVMAFPRNVGNKYEQYVKEVKPEIVTIDYNVDLSWAREKLATNTILQGNLSPMLLLSSKSEIAKQAKKIINILGKGRFIFNLGHGVLPNTPVENVDYLVKIIRDV